MRSTCIVVTLLAFSFAPVARSAWPIHSGNRIGDRLLPGQVLYGIREDYISASFDNFQLVMQRDCNLVLYNGPIPLWASGTNGRGAACSAVMQNDGNFVVYTTNRLPVWASWTQGNPGAWLHMQDDGNAVIYTKRALWASGTSGQGYDLISMPGQSGNTIVYRIDRPSVAQPRTQYPQIQFHPGDTVMINAGGCVQTGGSGRTWKHYVYPLGDNAGSLYSGTIYIPGVIPQAGGPSGYPRLAAWVNKSLSVPSRLPPTLPQPQLFLNLGYEDDNYGDNGYWGHDDGNPPQCVNTGPAWIEIQVVHRVVAAGGGPSPVPPPVSGQDQQSGQKPFDVVWDVNNLDGNGLPLNPIWAYQIAHSGGAPDFRAICGSAFSGGDKINIGTLAAICTTQDPTTDLSHSVFDSVGYCPGEPLKGHINWTLATHTGTIYWSGFSGEVALEDDDFNFNLITANKAGLTDLNKGALGLEFNADETINNFNAPFWVSFRNQVENLGANITGGSGSAGQLVSGKLAVVTGLFGIDGVHGGYSESHPVFAMAIRINEQAVTGGVDETWVFFLRNSGNEGGCSHLAHDWLPPAGWYYLSLPWPEHATGVTVSSAESQIWAYQTGVTPPTIETQPGWPWTYVGFQLPDPGVGAGVDGQITLHYAQNSRQMARTAHEPARAVTPDAAALGLLKPEGHDEEGGGLKELGLRIPDSATRQSFHQTLLSIPAAQAISHPHKLQLVLNPTVRVHKRVSSPARLRALIRDRAHVDPAMEAKRADLERAVLKIYPQNLLQDAANEDACLGGFVWREAYAGDHVCVTPAIRAQAAEDNQLVATRRLPNEDTCRQGFVWREAGPSDHVCVLPAVRQQAADDNRAERSRRVKP